MARKFGGKYSPGAARQADVVAEAVAEDRRVDAAGARANILFIPGLVLAVTSLGASAVGLALSLLGAASMTLGAWLLRDGLRAEAAFHARQTARRPALPRKIIAAVLAGAGVGLATWTNGAGLVGGAIYGAVAAGLHLVAFGIDPLSDKRMEGIDAFQQDRVARVVTEAEGYLATMREQIESLGDRMLTARVETFQALARKMIRTVEEDPSDLTGARKFLSVYLMGARDATVQFADVWRRTRDTSARADYEALLADLETNFAARTTQMLDGGRERMDLEIKVLRDRLQREGVRPE